MKLVILMVSKWNRYNFTKFIFVFTWIIIYLFRCWLPLWLQFRHLMTSLKNNTMVEATTTRIMTTHLKNNTKVKAKTTGIVMTHLKNNCIAQSTISIHTTSFQTYCRLSNFYRPGYFNNFDNDNAFDNDDVFFHSYFVKVSFKISKLIHRTFRIDVWLCVCILIIRKIWIINFSSII